MFLESVPTSHRKHDFNKPNPVLFLVSALLRRTLYCTEETVGGGGDSPFVSPVSFSPFSVCCCFFTDSQQIRSLQSRSISTMERYPCCIFFCILIYFHVFFTSVDGCCAVVMLFFSNNVIRIAFSSAVLAANRDLYILLECAKVTFGRKKQTSGFTYHTALKCFQCSSPLLPVFCCNRSMARRTAGTQNHFFFVCIAQRYTWVIPGTVQCLAGGQHWCNINCSRRVYQTRLLYYRDHIQPNIDTVVKIGNILRSIGLALAAGPIYYFFIYNMRKPSLLCNRQQMITLLVKINRVCPMYCYCML